MNFFGWKWDIFEILKNVHNYDAYNLSSLLIRNTSRMKKKKFPLSVCIEIHKSKL